MQIASIARSQSLPAAWPRRGQMILRLTDGETNSSVARCYRVGNPTLSLWCKRFADHSIAGPHNELKPGRPRSTGQDEIATLVHAALTRKPSSTTDSSCRSLADETELSKSAVRRCLALFRLHLHRSRFFRLSNDSFFIEKDRDTVGLHLNPPDHALVMCIDEKSRCRPTARTQPMLPMGLGCAEGITCDHVFHGATTLFAALDVANGTVLTQCQPNGRHKELLALLRHIQASAPRHLDVHMICDRHGPHTHARVKTRRIRRPRRHAHFTPACCSRLNQAKRCFAPITRQAIRCRSLKSAANLKRKIDEFMKRYNQHPRPPLRAATAELILAEINRLCKAVNGTRH